MPRAAHQRFAVAQVLRVLDGETGIHRPGAERAAGRRGPARDARRGDVARRVEERTRRGFLPLDQVLDVVAESGQRSFGAAHFVTQGKLAAAAGLGQQQRVAGADEGRVGEIQVVEGRRLEGAAGAGRHSPGVGQAVAVAEGVRVPRAELGIVVAARPDLPEMRARRAVPAQHQGIGAALQAGIDIGRVYGFAQALDGDQAASERQGQVVLPDHLVLARAEGIAVLANRGRRRGDRVVLAATQAQFALPGFGQARAGEHAMGDDPGPRLPIQVGGRPAAVEVADAVAFDAVGADLDALPRAPGGGQRQAAARKTVAVRVVGRAVRIGDGIDPLGARVGHAHGIVELSDAVGMGQRQFPAAAAADPGAGFQARGVGCAPGGDADHAADGIGTVQCRRRSAQDFDAFDLGQRNCFQRALPQRGRTDAQAVEQDQGMAGVGAADEYAFRGAAAAGARQLDPRRARQQVAEGGRRPGLLDGLAVDHGDVGNDFADPRRLARRGDDDGRELIGGEGKTGGKTTGRAGGDGETFVHGKTPEPRRASPQPVGGKCMRGRGGQ